MKTINDELKLLELFAKFLKTKPEVVIQFFIDFGLLIMTRAQLPILKKLQAALNHFIAEIETKS